jgi:hypothetical protein
MTQGAGSDVGSSRKDSESGDWVLNYWVVGCSVINEIWYRKDSITSIDPYKGLTTATGSIANSYSFSVSRDGKGMKFILEEEISRSGSGIFTREKIEWKGSVSGDDEDGYYYEDDDGYYDLIKEGGKYYYYDYTYPKEKASIKITLNVYDNDGKNLQH